MSVVRTDLFKYIAPRQVVALPKSSEAMSTAPGADVDYRVTNNKKPCMPIPVHMHNPSLLNDLKKEEVIKLDGLQKQERAILDLIDVYIDKYCSSETDCINYKYNKTENTLTLALGQALAEDQITLWRYRPKPTGVKFYFHEGKSQGHFSLKDIKLRNRAVQDTFDSAFLLVRKFLKEEENLKIFNKRFQELRADHHVREGLRLKDQSFKKIFQPKFKVDPHFDSLAAYGDRQKGFYIEWVDGPPKRFLDDRKNLKAEKQDLRKPGLYPTYYLHEVLHTLVDTSILHSDKAKKLFCHPALQSLLQVNFHERKQEFELNITALIDKLIKIPVHRNDRQGRQILELVKKQKNYQEGDLEDIFMLLFCGVEPSLKGRTVINRDLKGRPVKT